MRASSMAPISDPFESFLQAARDALESIDLSLRRAAAGDLLFFKPSLDRRFQAASTPDVKKKRGGVGGAGGARKRASAAADEDERQVSSSSSCSNCLDFAVCLSVFFGNFVQSLAVPIKSSKKRLSKIEEKKIKSGTSQTVTGTSDNSIGKEKEKQSIELFICCTLCNIVQNLQNLDQRCRESTGKSSSINKNSNKDDNDNDKSDHFKTITNLVFARVGGVPPSLAATVKEDDRSDQPPEPNIEREETENNSSTPQKLGSLLNIPLSNVERLKSTLPAISLTELIEFIPQLGKSSSDHPDKKKLFSVQDFFRYAESEGRRFFEELDRDGDGQVTLEDLEIAMRRRKLPKRYARDFLRRTRRHFFSKSIGWKQFLALMEQKEPTILRAYTTLCLSKSGTLQKSQILTSLRSVGLPASEDNAVAMMRYLNADAAGSISYGHFRNFMLLLPSERLEDDPRNVWFEAATLVAVPPPVEISTENVLKSALAGGLACALSTSVLHPIDTMKTRVQASTLSFPELMSKLPQIGRRGLYRGSIPAILGQFSSHGLRTGIFEASKLVLVNVAPTLPEIQVQSLASLCSTVLGTAVRIPCEVLKQRLQAGIFDNVGEAIVGTAQKDGLRGFFRGTGATLCREVPFYVAGMGLYAEAKKAAQNVLKRDLEPWETIVVGALSGGLAAVITTPFDVMKTRMMTAPQGMPISMQMVAFSILRKEGPLGLFKGAVPRFFWIAPLGAMNFAGYELAKKAMDKTEDDAGDQLREKRLAS